VNTERRSDTHKYCPRSSYFPSRILSLLFDKLLIIHFPSELERILNGSWSYYSSHGNALFDSIIQIQISITVQRNTTQGKQREKQRTDEVIDDEDTDIPDLSMLIFLNKLLKKPRNSCSNHANFPWVVNAERLKRQYEEATTSSWLNPALQKCKKAVAHGTAPAEVFLLVKYRPQAILQRNTDVLAEDDDSDSERIESLSDLLELGGLVGSPTILSCHRGEKTGPTSNPGRLGWA